MFFININSFTNVNLLTKQTTCQENEYLVNNGYMPTVFWLKNRKQQFPLLSMCENIYGIP